MNHFLPLPHTHRPFSSQVNPGPTFCHILKFRSRKLSLKLSKSSSTSHCVIFHLVQISRPCPHQPKDNHYKMRKPEKNLPISTGEEREIKSHHHYNGRGRILLNRKLRESSTGHVPVCSELRLKFHLQNYLLYIFLVFGTAMPLKEVLTRTLLVECFCGSSEWACWIRFGKGSPLPEPISFWMAVYWW